jgi:hypothetical protein
VRDPVRLGSAVVGATDVASVPAAAGALARVDQVPAVPVLTRAAEDAARELFTGRAVDISSFLDEKSGRYVCRVADRETGTVIAQTPPEELLRFFASARADVRSLVGIEA